MNILFYTHGKVYATRGGTERTTVSVASALTRLYGCRCFSLYEVAEETSRETCFEAEFNWQASRDRQKDINTLRRIVTEHGIDFIIDQGIFIHVKLLREAVDGTRCQVILAHHFEPGAEVLYMSLKSHWAKHRNHMTWRQRARWLHDLLLYPLARHSYEETLRRTYREAYYNAHRVVLLSRSFIQSYQKFGRFNDNANFAIIPNSLSFDEFLPVEAINQKKPVVLIVARMEEVHKRLSLALDIWAQAKREPWSKGWQLKLVGEGKDLPTYKHMVVHGHIPDVSFEGRQAPKPYYREASIFLMTSRSESWGLTLTEAQQMGVVPVAFDTYASLREIITDGSNGMVLAEGDIDGYLNSLHLLMTDTDRRRHMAQQAIISSKRFAQDKIAEMWWKLLSEK